MKLREDDPESLSIRTPRLTFRGEAGQFEMEVTDPKRSMDRDELAIRLAKADRELCLLRRASRELRAAGREALRRRKDDERRRSRGDRPSGGSPPRTG